MNSVKIASGKVAMFVFATLSILSGVLTFISAPHIITNVSDSSVNLLAIQVVSTIFAVLTTIISYLLTILIVNALARIVGVRLHYNVLFRLFFSSRIPVVFSLGIEVFYIILLDRMIPKSTSIFIGVIVSILSQVLMYKFIEVENLMTKKQNLFIGVLILLFQNLSILYILFTKI